MKKNPKILLISPLFRDPRYILMPSVENLGLEYLAAYLRKNSFKVDIFDAGVSEINHKRILNHLPSKNYDVVGISASPQVLITEAAKIAREIKSCLPKCHIVIGGHFPTLAHQQILAEIPDIDSVVRGEGEKTLLELVKILQTREDLRKIKGLSYRNSSGQIFANEPRKFHDNLDTLPWPARDTLLQIKSFGHSWISQVSYSRGCFGNCTFCDITKFYGGKRRIRSIKDLVDEIEYLSKLGCKDFRFADDESIGSSAASKSSIKSMALEIIKRGLDIRYGINSRATSIDLELFKILKESGLELCFTGIESGVNRILSLYNKGITAEQNLAAIDRLRKLDIKLELGFVMFDPRMNFQELRQNYQFLKDNNLITLMGLRNWFQPLFGTRIVEQLRDESLIKKESLAEIEYSFEDNKVEDVFQIICRSANILFDVEHALYMCEKSVRFSTMQQLALEEQHLALWKDIFESALENTGDHDFARIEKRSKELLKTINSTQKNP